MEYSHLGGYKMLKELTYFEGIIFPRDEYSRRYELLQKLMARDGFDALMLTDDRYTWYYSGFGTTGPMGARCRPKVLFIPAKGKPIFLVHQSTAFCVSEMFWGDSIRTYSNLEHAPVEDIIVCIKELGLTAGAVIGAELGREQRINLPYGDYANIASILSQYSFSDAGDILLEQRMVKTPLEIERIRKACLITSEAYKLGFKKLKEGMTEAEAGAILESTMQGLGASGTWSWVIASDYHRIDGLTRNKPIERGKLIFVDMGANVGGYWSDFSRSAVIGKPEHDFEKVLNIITGICIAGVEASKPGVTTASVARILDEKMAENGLPFNACPQRYGHGMGITTTEPPNFWKTDEIEIKENMVLTIEPGSYNDHGMFHIEENFVVRADGPEYLSLAPREITYI